MYVVIVARRRIFGLESVFNVEHIIVSAKQQLNERLNIGLQQV
jgi:hypothetical protein